MMKTRRMRELIFLQLRQYNDTKRMLGEYEELGLKARPLVPRARTGLYGDPTAADALRLLEPNEEIKRMQGWVWAIEEALAMLKRDAPHKAQLMELLFFADTGDTPSDSCARRELLLDELHISEPTLYRWRDDIMQAVMAGAIEAGVLSPYGRVSKPRPEKAGGPVTKS
ncbi:MAG TPA: hypothetical protein VN366_07200 [Feifaniaceae bacterium]|nr:hypothetical protein [Feifaniaceae bacterium]